MMIEYVARGVLGLHGFMVGKHGISYIRNPQNEILLSLLNEKGTEGPGLEITTPFLGLCYLTIGALNVFAAVRFCILDASSVLIVSGLFYQIGMSIVRSRLDPRIADLYKPGMIRRFCSYGYGVGIILCGIGVLGCVKSYVFIM